MLGWHRPAFNKNRLGGRVGQILTQVPVDVAVFIDRDRAPGKIVGALRREYP